MEPQRLYTHVYIIYCKKKIKKKLKKGVHKKCKKKNKLKKNKKGTLM